MSDAPNNGLVSILKAYSGYEDRFQMLFELTDHVDRHVILTAEPVPIPAGERPDALEIRHSGGDHPFFWGWAASELRELLSQVPTEDNWVVHEHTNALSVFVYKLLGGDRPTVASMYSTSVRMLATFGWTADPWAGEISLRQHTVYTRFMAKKSLVHALSWFAADHVTGNSGHVVETIRRARPDIEVPVVPACIDVGAVRETESRPPERSWRTEGLKLLYAGNNRPFKGIATLFRALRTYLDRGYEAELMLVGGGMTVDSPWVDRMIETHGVGGAVTQIERVPKAVLIWYYRNADVFVFPSFDEGSPRVVKEAMISELPVVASDIPGVRMLDPEARALRYFEPGDTETLADHLVRLTDQPELRRRSGTRGARLAESFTPEATARHFADLYRDKGLLYK